jgi:hypothetical protein
MTATEAYMDELATIVAAKVLEQLRKEPVVQPRLLTIEQAAIVLGRSEKAVRHLMVSGVLKNAVIPWLKRPHFPRRRSQSARPLAGMR